MLFWNRWLEIRTGINASDISHKKLVYFLSNIDEKNYLEKLVEYRIIYELQLKDYPSDYLMVSLLYDIANQNKIEPGNKTHSICFKKISMVLKANESNFQKKRLQKENDEVLYAVNLLDSLDLKNLNTCQIMRAYKVLNKQIFTSEKYSLITYPI